MAETSPERRLMLYGDPISPSTASCFNRFRFRERGRKLVDDTDLSGSVDGWEKKNNFFFLSDTGCGDGDCRTNHEYKMMGSACEDKSNNACTKIHDKFCLWIMKLKADFPVLQNSQCS